MRTLRDALFGLGIWLSAAVAAFANIPGGGDGTGQNVTITDNGSTVTMANGIVSVVITKTSAEIHTINYTFNNTGSSQTLNLLAGGTDGGKLYWFQNGGTFIAGPFTESVVANTGDYAEIKLVSASATNGVMEIHYSMLRGSPGFYTTAILTHRSSDGNMHIELRPNIYAGSIFNWMSVDGARNRLMEVSGGSAIGVQGAPKECTLWTSGIYAGQYEDKYKYSADLGTNRVWGWSSVGTGGKNIGLWNVSASGEYYPGGPMMRELMEHIGTTILNVFTGNYYGMSTDGGLQDGETWSHVYGPYLYYCNAVTNTLTGADTAAQALRDDALAQGDAEKTAWPYSWFNNPNYVPASGRGTVTGTMVINDSGNPNASAAGLWVGLVRQPSTAYDSVYDFQQWMKPYQFWTQTDTNGNFTIPHVIATNNYTLYAFGPGAAGTFISQNQTGGSPPILYDLPASRFSVTVMGGATDNLGTVTWTPSRVGATVFQIGYPDRSGDKFRHGDDYWVGDIGPSPSAPSPIWSKWLEYPFDFPNGVNYVVGQSRWTTDWNFCQPVTVDSQGNYNNSSSTITFNLASAPAGGATASLYLGLSSDYYAAIIVTVNGQNLGSVSGVTGSPNNSIPTTGYYVGYGKSDTTIREGNNGAFSDERITFPASILQQGQNTITIGIRQVGGSYFADHAMYDYIRLELTGYVPPAPASVAAYPGDNANLICWPVTPGATSYNVFRSTTSGSGYSLVASGVVGPVCGSGPNNATYLDTTAANGTTYYYEVQSVNANGHSGYSLASPAAVPGPGNPTSAPAAPAGVTVASVGHHRVTLNWSASSGANFYTVYRSTLVNNGGGRSNVLSTIVLANNVTGTSYTDASPTDGSIYRYIVTATDAGGTSPDSTPVTGVPLPAAPSSAPPSLTASFVYGSTTNITLNWTAVPGAVGYVISRATSPDGPYTYLQTVTETTYTDYGLNPAIVYYYRVAAMNAASVSGNNTDSVNSQIPFPASLTAVATNTEITLTWSPVSGATSYTVKRGTSPGNETFTVVSGYSGTTYTNAGLANNTTYYYVVTASGAGGTSGNSPEASATTLIAGTGIWITAADGSWGVATNWSDGSIASGSGNIADFSTLALPADLTVTLDSPRTISGLKFGDRSATYNWTLAGANTLTLGASPDIDVVNQSATISTPVAGTSGLAKSGLGALTLGGAANSFTGGVSADAGSLALDYSASGSPTDNLVPAANALTLGGSALQVIGSSSTASSQTFSATTLNAGESVVSAAPASGANDPTVNVGGISTTVNGGQMIQFNGPPTIGAGGASVASSATITTATSGGSGLIADHAIYGTVGLYDYAATSGSSSPYTVVGGSQISGFYTAYSGGNAGPTAGNVDLTGTSIGWSGIPYLQSMRFNAGLGADQSVNNNGGYNTLQTADILVTPNVGAHNVTFNISNLRPNTSTGGSGPEIVWQNNPAGELIINSSINQPNHGSYQYDDAYEQGGPGTVVLNNTGNNLTLQSYLNGGVTLIAGNGSLGPATIGAAINLNGGTLVGNGTFALDNAGANLRPVNLLGNGGGLAATAGNTMTVDGVVGSATGGGPLTIGIPASSANNDTAGLLPGTGPGTANSAVYAIGTVVLNNANNYSSGTVLQSGTLNFNGLNALGGTNSGGLTFNGGTLQYAASFPGANGSADLTADGTAGITLAAGGGTIDLNGNAVTYTNSLGNGGSGGLTVGSALAGGELTLLGDNAYTGNTIVTNATLLAENLNGSATGSGNVTVQKHGVLTGNGSLAGSVTVETGGTLMPGDPLGSLTIGNDLTLASGSTNAFEIQPSPLANSVVSVGGAVTEGGTLVVTKAGATAFAAGDHFQLLSAAGYNGVFDNVNAPSLGAGLVWDTSRLNVDGTLWIISTNSPAITTTRISGTNLICSGSGGTPGGYYYVLSTTNLALPLAQWTPITTNQFDLSGNFNATNVINPEWPQTFYRLQLQ